MAAAFIQFTQTSWAGTSGFLSQSLVFTSDITLASCVVLGIAWFNTSASIVSVIDGNGVSYNLIDFLQDGTAGKMATYQLPNSVGGTLAKTITVTWSADPSSGDLMAMEVSGADPASPVDGTAHTINTQADPGTSTDAVTSGNVTTTAADFVFAMTWDTGLSSDTWSAGTVVAWTGEGALPKRAYAEWFVQSAPGTIAATFTQNNRFADILTAIVCITPPTVTADPSAPERRTPDRPMSHTRRAA